MTTPAEIPSDHELLVATRAGSAAAWDQLAARVRPLLDAIALPRSGRGARSAVDEALDRLHAQLVAADDDTADPTGTRNVRALRPRAIACLTGGTYGPGAVEPGSSTDDRSTLMLVADAFGRISATWQTILWRRWVELEPAASLAAALGRPASAISGLEQAAASGLFDGYAAAVLATPGAAEPGCRSVVARLGGYRRGTLPDADRRDVEAHLDGDGADAGCGSCRRHLEVADRFPAVVPAAIVPDLAGVGVDRYRGLVGVGVGAVGASALARRRADRNERLARLGAVAAIVAALLAAAILIRSPFDDFDSELAELTRPPSTSEPVEPGSTVPGTTSPESADPGDGDPGDGAPGSGGAGDGAPGSDEAGDGSAPLPNRVELVFSGALQGITYVPGPEPLELVAALSMPAPAFDGGTVTVDASITNRSARSVAAPYVIRVSRGLAFDELVEGDGSCRAVGEGGASCSLALGAGETGSVSLRFLVARDVPDRLVVAPNIPGDTLDVPVERVDDLVVATVTRGALSSTGGPLPACRQEACPAGVGVLALPGGTRIDRASLSWRGDRRDAPERFEVDGPRGSGGVVRAEEQGDGVVADVTDLVRAAGAGEYSVRADEGTPAGGWALLVTTVDPDAERRLVVVTAPPPATAAGAPVEVAIPIESPAPPGPPRRPVRDVGVAIRLQLEAGEDVDDSIEGTVAVAGSDVGGDEPFDVVGRATAAGTYALAIDASTPILVIAAATRSSPIEPIVVGAAVEIVT